MLNIVQMVAVLYITSFDILAYCFCFRVSLPPPSQPPPPSTPRHQRSTTRILFRFGFFVRIHLELNDLYWKTHSHILKSCSTLCKWSLFLNLSLLTVWYTVFVSVCFEVHRAVYQSLCCVWSWGREWPSPVVAFLTYTLYTYSPHTVASNVGGHLACDLLYMHVCITTFWIKYCLNQMCNYKTTYSLATKKFGLHPHVTSSVRIPMNSDGFHDSRWSSHICNQVYELK